MRAQETTERNVVVTAESDEGEHDQFTELGEYGQPAWAERSRFSSTTSVYVLSPYEIFVGNIWETDFRRHGKTLHDLKQQIDFGLPHRFEIGLENDLGLSGSDAHETSGTLEARYAFANWDVVPLNPTISVEYIFGFGKSVRAITGDGNLHQQSDAVAFGLLLGQNFGEHFGYGLNLGFQQDVARDSGREFEVNMAITYGAMEGRVELGAEMRYTRETQFSDAEFGIGPTIGWKPTRQFRISFASLFGATGDSPGVSTFVLFSYEFGGAEAIVAPVSATR